jgi:hypothetical protein
MEGATPNETSAKLPSACSLGNEMQSLEQHSVIFMLDTQVVQKTAQ